MQEIAALFTYPAKREGGFSQASIVSGKLNIIMSILSKFSLAGKTALVTGCKRGIGKSIAVALAEAGADIIGVSASLELTGSKVQQEVEATGRSFKAYQADFNDRKAIYAFIDKVNG